MQLVYSGQSNVLDLPMVTTAGAPITSGTVTFYLYRQSDSKWYKGSDGSWSDSEQSAGAGSHIADGHWKISLASAVWTADIEYLAYAKESGGLHIPIDDSILCIGELSVTAGAMSAQSTMTMADLLAFIQAAFGDTTSNISESDIEQALKLALSDISNKDLLVTENTSASLSSGDYAIDFPTGYRSLIALTIATSSDRYKPLYVLKDGISEWEYLMAGSVSTGRPQYYAKFNGKFYLYHPADGDYDVKIKYYKNHADSTTIEFGDEFNNLIKTGTCYWFATLRRNKQYIDVWGANFARLLDDMIDSKPTIARIL